MVDILDATFGRFGNRLFQMAYIYNQAKKGIIPDIYLQGEEYFKESSEDIKRLFRKDVMLINRIAIHVRRGDYVNNPFYVDLMSTGYYEYAMAEFPYEKFLVFSDDINWCKDQDIFYRCEFSEGNEMDDFNAMAGCRGHVIANSSYSWWAAYIAPKTKKVVAPNAWYTDGITRTTCPESWVRI